MEHQNENGQYDILIYKQDRNVLMTKNQSRHVTKTKYKLWIEYDECTVKGWFCQCKCGTRVVVTWRRLVSWVCHIQ